MDNTITRLHAIKLWSLAVQEQAVAITPEGEIVSNFTPFTSALYYLNIPRQLNYRSDIEIAVKFLREWADALEQIKT